MLVYIKQGYAYNISNIEIHNVRELLSALFDRVAYSTIKWDKVFKNEPSKICER